MRAKGRFFWKKIWFSICSMHFDYNEECSMCRAGNWTNVWEWKIGGAIHDICPRLWRWWVNRPGSKQRKQLEEIFPKFKKNQNGSTGKS
jgi:hypothetical protein